MILGLADYERALTAAGVTELHVAHHATTGSTNDDARALVGSASEGGGAWACLVIAEEQTKGRGRGGNVWLSPQGSISMTLTLAGVPVDRLGVLPLGVGAAVTAALRGLGITASVKWPNDVLIHGLKACGILCESSLLGSMARVFIGIGINVDDGSARLNAELKATAVSEHAAAVDRPALVADIASRVLSMICSEAAGRDIVEGWKAVSVPWWGEEVTLLDGGVERRVTLLDVNPLGQLVVRDEGGVVRSLVSGEVRQLRVVAP
ncbi:MAG: biotin--[acetyl-CoA-carboxylase] ligase [Vicinamibacteria bacterium]